MNEKGMRWYVRRSRGNVPKPWNAFAPAGSDAPSMCFESFDRAIGYAHAQADRALFDYALRRIREAAK